jgi:hypothetical protein
MQGENRSRVPFDDRAALEELERLQRSIQDYRRRREAAEGAFEEFVGSFRKPAPQPSAAAPVSRGVPSPVSPSPVAVAPAVPPQRPVPTGLDAFASSGQAPASAAPPSLPEPATPAPISARPAANIPQAAPSPIPVAGTFLPPGPVDTVDDELATTAGRRQSRRAMHGRVPLVLGGAAILLLAILLVTRTRNAASGPSPAPVQAAVETPVAARVPAPAAPPPVAAPVVPPAEIRTVRTVWVRVLVDGNREVERELQANVVVPLPAGRTYVIRAGDAGAVRFMLNGQDQGPLGRDGIVATRTFPAPAR